MPKFLIIIIIVLVVLIANGFRMRAKSASHHFECPQCDTHFQVPFAKYMFTAHSMDGKCSVKCPNCGRSNFLPPMPGTQ
ncbi:MAG: hypothetical protein FWF28_06000 [Micrococcales bacterium]|nr:hypothetical protein [Micrococcales bacterium]